MPNAQFTSITACDFCGKAHDEVGKLIAGPDVCICDACVANCASLTISQEPPDKNSQQGREATSQQACSFCGKVEPDVARIAEKDVCICAECIELCLEMCDGDDRDRSRRAAEYRRKEQEKWTERDIANGLDYTVRNRLSTRDTYYIFTRLPITASAQKEFVETWRRQLSAALLQDGAKQVSYAYVGTAKNKSTWLVFAESEENLCEVGFFTKFVLEKMHSAGILLRRSSWYFLEGTLHDKSY